MNIICKDIVPNYMICEINNTRIILHKNLIESQFSVIEKLDKRIKDLRGKQFNNWRVIKYIGDRKWICQCSCGRYAAITGYNLYSNKTKSCGHEKISDLSGQKFGEWEVIKYIGVEHGMTKWQCKCSCGKIKDIYASRLLNGRSKSCGHNTNTQYDLTGQQFGEWTVLRYIGNKYWECKCSCGTIKNINTSSLIRGMSKSCGHATNNLRRETLLNKYGEIATNKKDKRETWQIEVVKNKENFRKYILDNFNIPVKAAILADKLNINKNSIYRKIHEFELEYLLEIDYNSSQYEDEICDILDEINIKYIRRYKLPSNKEVDIYVPESHIGIEFNGSYWHSELFKDKLYHKSKTVECNRNNIDLIHIFEYEWESNKNKIIRLIKNRVTPGIKIGARKTNIMDIGSKEALEFLNEYHLHGGIASKIYIGIKYNSELIGVASLGKPRYTNIENSIELLRLSWKDNIHVIGGFEKIIKYIHNKNINNIISYVDISKFTGSSYERVGFIEKYESEPGYVWYNKYNKSILTRYQTQKYKLIELGICNESETENDVMHRLGYIRIYDCGNKVMIHSIEKE